MVRAKATRVFDWFRRKYGEPTPAQAEAWPRIDAGEDVLVASPTGTGKTFAAFLGVIDALAQEHDAGTLEDSITASTSRRCALWAMISRRI
jgi:ATP-dependent Lhr-like helicase